MPTPARCATCQRRWCSALGSDRQTTRANSALPKPPGQLILNRHGNRPHACQKSSIGPAMTVHPDGNSAFSFNRDMLLHWWWLYRSSELLARVVEHASASIPANAAVAADPPVATPGAVEPWSDLCQAVASLRADFMPDEVRQPYPMVVVTRLADSMRLRFPAGRRANAIRGEAKFTNLLSIDEVGQAYKLPYFGNDANALTVEAN